MTVKSTHADHRILVLLLTFYQEDPFKCKCSARFNNSAAAVGVLRPFGGCGGLLAHLVNGLLLKPPLASRDSVGSLMQFGNVYTQNSFLAAEELFQSRSILRVGATNIIESLGTAVPRRNFETIALNECK